MKDAATAVLPSATHAAAEAYDQARDEAARTGLALLEARRTGDVAAWLRAQRRDAAACTALEAARLEALGPDGRHHEALATAAHYYAAT